MNEEKALQIIRKNPLKPKNSMLWWSEEEEKQVAELLEALEALKDDKKITGRKFLKEKFDFAYDFLSIVRMYLEGKASKERMPDIANLGKANECLDTIVKQFEIKFIELGLNSRDAPEREAFCVPGCGLCCCLTRGSGVAVFNNEVGQVQLGIANFNAEHNEHLVLDTEDIPRKSRSYEWVGRFKHAKSMVAALPASTEIPRHIRELGELGFRYKGNLGYACHLLVDRRTERLDFGKWKALALSYMAALRQHGMTLNLTEADFPGGFQGLMCGIHQHRPHECRSNGCNYARKIMPIIIRKHGTLPLERMFKEPTLIGRFSIANSYFKS